MPNILVTGSNGQLGSEIRALASEENIFYFTDSNALDITDRNAIECFCEENAIDIILNCAAYTDVDEAEKEMKNADRVNHLAVKYLAEIARMRKMKLVHISTDYVFDGTNCKPYVEEDTTGPNGVYGSTKLLGEEVLKMVNPHNAIIIRTSWVYSSFGNNFVKTMLRLGTEREELGVIFDQVGTPTYAGDLAKTILQIVPKIENENVEVYHFSNEGVCSWFDLAKAIFELGNVKCEVSPIETKAYPTPAKRPYYSVLNKTKIKTAFGISIPYWKESLGECLKKIQKEKE
ncbi:dTDP-4-dehydrorhamnose reductase [Sulfurovum sp. NBC37-1]|uniref:dTDP-4-dehydrorhamnose reductase n=1 Tax=Sulfurovum sp. (strain NBC37-1) TaxID=387093 RepID=UPI0001587957|nr:dTDP-4-dehydrorhamnose reductase [Sulfurovum sp. NBC37-1]BAF72665.1 dTDP-4-dehydrorhamnose reductase [Sulfurovum sp. NBC37-1]